MWVAGLDEVGRGCLAGPVVAAAVILAPDCRLPGLADSKALTARQRAALVPQIHEAALAYAIGRAEASEIDRLNILQATFLAMRRALAALPRPPERLLVDGALFPDLGLPGQAVVQGDARVPAIAAASVLAKVWRDREMAVLDALFPAYAFAHHKGYGTPAHRQALQVHGPSRHHRHSFAPVRQAGGMPPLPQQVGEKPFSPTC